MILNFYEHKPSAGTVPKQAVFLLHGLGADGRDLLGLAPYFAKYLPDAVFVSPDAPFACDMAPFGYQWFSLQSWSPASILKGVQDSAPMLRDFIVQRLSGYGIGYERCALVGFSQGTMMSLYVAPRLQQSIAGVVGYSGALVWESEIDAAKLHKTPVHLIHGEADQVVPISAYHMARMTLQHYDFPVSGYTQPFLMHSIDEKGIASGGEFLRKVLV
ncbi:MAG: alpha/beta hydrolase [Alphaproteobacteria bacterium]|nr:alpha/beta hydrolase [Alphaproteobacteria bacterium]